MNFNEIPVNLLTPGVYVEIDSSRAVQGLSELPARILVIGQRLAAGTVAALQLRQITRKAQAETYFGRGSMLAEMLIASLTANPYAETWAIALDDDVAGVAATGEIALTGPATAAGALAVYIGGVKVSVAVAAADTATAVGAALAAAINANTRLPVTASANAGTVTLTCRWKGLTGNAVDVRVNYNPDDQTPAGLAAAITAMNSGATNPDMADAIAAISDVQYTTWISAFTDSANLTVLKTELARRFGPMVPYEGIAHVAIGGTYSDITTAVQAINSPHVVAMGLAGSPTAPWLWASVAGAIDQGEPDPARPRQTLMLPGLLPGAPDALYTREERNIHLAAGVATHTVDAGGICRIERLVTTYTENAQGIEDTAFQDVEILRTLAALRYTLRARLALRFPRYKIGDDGTPAPLGSNIVTPSTIRGELVALYMDWIEAGWVEGGEPFEQFKQELSVERDATDVNRVNVLLPPDLINQLRVIAAQIQFLK